MAYGIDLIYYITSLCLNIPYSFRIMRFLNFIKLPNHISRKPHLWPPKKQHKELWQPQQQTIPWIGGEGGRAKAKSQPQHPLSLPSYTIRDCIKSQSHPIQLSKTRAPDIDKPISFLFRRHVCTKKTMQFFFVHLWIVFFSGWAIDFVVQLY